MRKSRLLMVLFAALLAACGTAEPSNNSPEIASATPFIAESTATPVVDLTVTPIDTDTLNTATLPPTATAEAIATSRGPNLEATDPTTVSLASGGVQFVEFFRFT